MSNIISQTLFRKRIDPASNEVSIGMILPEPADTPIFVSFGTEDMRKISDYRNQIETSLAGTEIKMSLYTSTNSTFIKGKNISHNTAFAEAGAIITGETDSGLKLEIIGAFDPKGLSAFYWG